MYACESETELAALEFAAGLAPRSGYTADPEIGVALESAFAKSARPPAKPENLTRHTEIISSMNSFRLPAEQMSSGAAVQSTKRGQVS